LSRRVRLPAADELFRPTVVPTQTASSTDTADPAKPPATPPPQPGPRSSSGRVRHDEKMTVYVTAEELLELEQARLMLRRLGLGVDRGRLVREAIAITLADLHENADESVIVNRLLQA
jgi:hypothetical protein